LKKEDEEFSIPSVVTRE